jgi:hypothetical protein
MKIKKLPVIVADRRNFDKRFFMIGRQEKIESDKPIILSSVRDKNVFNAEPPRVFGDFEENSSDSFEFL